MGKTPADLLVADWDAVKPVPETLAKQSPALHYYTQRFRTRSLGDFMAAQRRIAHAAFGGDFPVVANFSDGVVYDANCYAQGVDYFELLDADDGQNAVWGEDWSNGALTNQCAAFNVDLMRAASRRRGQFVGHFLISYAKRTPWDVKLKAVGEVGAASRRSKASSTARRGPATRAGRCGRAPTGASTRRCGGDAELRGRSGRPRTCSCRPCPPRRRWRWFTARRPTPGPSAATGRTGSTG